MPIPKPTSGETESEFVSRCIEAIYDEYGQEQSSAICYSTWRDRMSKIDSTNRVMGKMKRVSEYRGIDLTKLENGLEDACWPGYEAIGTKILDGREVPNCVPIED